MKAKYQSKVFGWDLGGLKLAWYVDISRTGSTSSFLSLGPFPSKKAARTANLMVQGLLLYITKLENKGETKNA